MAHTDDEILNKNINKYLLRMMCMNDEELDSAIEWSDDMAAKCFKSAENSSHRDTDLEMGNRYSQVAGWLRELKEFREKAESLEDDLK